MTEQILPEDTPYQGVPYVGCAATRHSGSDSYPATVVWVSKETFEYTYEDRRTGGRITVQMPKKVRTLNDRYRALGPVAFTENQKYQYYSEAAPSNSYSDEWSWRPQRKNYVRVGDSWRTSCSSPSFGYRRAYRDPSF